MRVIESSGVDHARVCTPESSMTPCTFIVMVMAWLVGADHIYCPSPHFYTSNCCELALLMLLRKSPSTLGPSQCDNDKWDTELSECQDMDKTFAFKLRGTRLVPPAFGCQVAYTSREAGVLNPTRIALSDAKSYTTSRQAVYKPRIAACMASPG